MPDSNVIEVVEPCAVRKVAAMAVTLWCTVSSYLFLFGGE